MKPTLAVLAGLLFVSTVAVGQYGGGSPFPQAANPALRSGEVVPLPLISPSSMAADSTSVLAWHPKVDTGSPFPQVANPSLGSGTGGQTSPSDNVDTGSPFPQAANPSRGSE
jgi:hypothetical protein